MRGRPPARRLVALLAAMLVALGGVVARLAFLQVRDAGALEAQGEAQRVRTLTLPAERGDILDRSGTPLAVTVEAADVYADPRSVTDPRSEAEALAQVLGVRPVSVRPSLSGTGTFEYVARQVDVHDARAIEDLALPGIGTIPSSLRSYPAGALAPQVVGFVGVDGVGLEGLEQQYDDLLSGTPGRRTIELSPTGQEIASGIEVEAPPVPGATVRTTLDRQLQFQAQAALRRAVHDNGAKGGTVVVFDPRTGAVYAMATYPWFDPNAFVDAPEEVRRNRPITDTFEPGSTNKTITAAAALETGSVGPLQLFQVPGARQIDDDVIEDAHPHPIESMTLADIVAESSNVGISMVADRVGSSALASYVSKFGFGRTTGTGFPGEAAGLLPPDPEWSPLTRATVSFGEGIAVTPMQMASVYGTIANGGVWVQPRLVDGWETADGTFTPAPTLEHRRVIRRETARTLTQMLSYAVAEGTGTAASIPGYQVAGKTGTARIPAPSGGYYAGRYMASFIGFFPAKQPRLVVAAILQEPDTVYGGVAAAPLFQQVARAAIQRLAIPPAAEVGPPPGASLDS